MLALYFMMCVRVSSPQHNTFFMHGVQSATGAEEVFASRKTRAVAPLCQIANRPKQFRFPYLLNSFEVFFHSF